MPQPRYAHQLVFDWKEKVHTCFVQYTVCLSLLPYRFADAIIYVYVLVQVHYLFGGNPGDKVNKLLRLADFW